MPRPRKHRCCRSYQADRIYKPQGVPMAELGLTEVAADEFEALRLCDGEGLDQAAAGLAMGVSRGTVQRLLQEARRKLVRAIVERRAVVINLTRQEDCHAGLHPHRGRHRS